jgi:hypothetical protein
MGHCRNRDRGPSVAPLRNAGFGSALLRNPNSDVRRSVDRRPAVSGFAAAALAPRHFGKHAPANRIAAGLCPTPRRSSRWAGRTAPRRECPGFSAGNRSCAGGRVWDLHSHDCLTFLAPSPFTAIGKSIENRRGVGFTCGIQAPGSPSCSRSRARVGR